MAGRFFVPVWMTEPEWFVRGSFGRSGAKDDASSLT